MAANPYPWQDLKLRWERESLTHEQVIGQLIVWGETLYTQLIVAQRQAESRQRQIEELVGRIEGLEKRLEQTRAFVTARQGNA